MIILDTSAVFAFLNRDDPNHSHAASAFDKADGPFVIPALIMAEIGYLVGERLGQLVLDAFLEDVVRQSYLIDYREPDFTRVRTLARRYADLPLGFADAAVIACAERRRGSVLTFDIRHFSVVAREQTFEMFKL